MRTRWFGLLVLLLLAGCADRQIVVQRYELTDLKDGKTYIAEGREINKTAGGVVFRQEGTGDSISLSDYRERQIEPAVYRLVFNRHTGEWEREGRVDHRQGPTTR